MRFNGWMRERRHGCRVCDSRKDVLWLAGEDTRRDSLGTRAEM
jgi:hypothetical protein